MTRSQNSKTNTGSVVADILIEMASTGKPTYTDEEFTQLINKVSKQNQEIEDED